MPVQLAYKQNQTMPVQLAYKKFQFSHIKNAWTQGSKEIWAAYRRLKTDVVISTITPEYMN